MEWLIKLGPDGDRPGRLFLRSSNFLPFTLASPTNQKTRAHMAAEFGMGIEQRADSDAPFGGQGRFRFCSRLRSRHGK